MSMRLVFICFFNLVHTESTPQTTLNVSQSTPKMVANDVSTPYPLEVNPLQKSLWLHRPEALQSLQYSPAQEVYRNVIHRQPLLVTKLTRPLGFGVAPYFHKVYFQPFERRKKPVVILALKKQGVAPIKMKHQNWPPEVAVLQSPYNEIDSHATDEANLNAEIEKIC